MATSAVREADLWRGSLGKWCGVTDSNNVCVPTDSEKKFHRMLDGEVRETAAQLIESLASCDEFNIGAVMTLRMRASGDSNWTSERICWSLLSIASATLRKEDPFVAAQTATNAASSSYDRIKPQVWRIGLTLARDSARLPPEILRSASQLAG